MIAQEMISTHGMNTNQVGVVRRNISAAPRGEPTTVKPKEWSGRAGQRITKNGVRNTPTLAICMCATLDKAIGKQLGRKGGCHGVVSMTQGGGTTRKNGVASIKALHVTGSIKRSPPNSAVGTNGRMPRPTDAPPS